MIDVAIARCQVLDTERTPTRRYFAAAGAGAHRHPATRLLTPCQAFLETLRRLHRPCPELGGENQWELFCAHYRPRRELIDTRARTGPMRTEPTPRLEPITHEAMKERRRRSGCKRFDAIRFALLAPLKQRRPGGPALPQ